MSRDNWWFCLGIICGILALFDVLAIIPDLLVLFP